MTRPTKTLATLGATAALLLTGCTQQTPDPLPTQAASATPTPTPTTTLGPYEAETPKDQATAIKDAAAAYQQFLDTTMDVYSHPEDTTGLDEIAIDPALGDITAESEELAKAGATVTGSMSFEVDMDTSYSAPSANGNGEKIEHGTVALKGCRDRSNFKLQNKDGTEVSGADKNPRFLVDVTVVYSIDTGRWLVKDVDMHRSETC
ncbi:hypothetical protein JRG19_10025 [Pseudoclavibacter alba]|uniref:hypothetical protein n=1 Tax=Pseudoclavibacter albus TaxID=272241 RepID=UPI0019CF902B|nr:hypothetical protein [Pseudoclavibacter alba]MBN6778866.1 hypothetical protein [Pseudoclavibacter alba]